MKQIIIGILLLFYMGCSSTNIKYRRISKHFVLKEAISSYTARKYKINNTPSSSEYKNIVYTANRMEEVRRVLKTKIYVTSWYRSKKLNQKVNGSYNSYHRKGLAVDFKIKGKAKYIKNKLARAKISYDQLIYYPKQNRIHISFRLSRKKERKQYFIF